MYSIVDANVLDTSTFRRPSNREDASMVSQHRGCFIRQAILPRSLHVERFSHRLGLRRAALVLHILSRVLDSCT